MVALYEQGSKGQLGVDRVRVQCRQGPGSKVFSQVSASNNFALRVHLHARYLHSILSCQPHRAKNRAAASIVGRRSSNGAKAEDTMAIRQFIAPPVRRVGGNCTFNMMNKKNPYVRAGGLVFVSELIACVPERQLKVTELLRLARHCGQAQETSIIHSLINASVRRCRGAHWTSQDASGASGLTASRPATHSLPCGQDAVAWDVR